ncbi:MAG: hypothetical protein A2506_05370 [Elusimicrobia bacterium RIFOXYD12_FULL_66_9]|nr:MAG: hypothetical protein A2506_05370 [Elusimicrobia bacterium RIFOXYD12_FULL_66_9]
MPGLSRALGLQPQELLGQVANALGDLALDLLPSARVEARQAGALALDAGVLLDVVELGQRHIQAVGAAELQLHAVLGAVAGDGDGLHAQIARHAVLLMNDEVALAQLAPTDGLGAFRREALPAADAAPVPLEYLGGGVQDRSFRVQPEALAQRSDQELHGARGQLVGQELLEAGVFAGIEAEEDDLSAGLGVTPHLGPGAGGVGAERSDGASTQVDVLGAGLQKSAEGERLHAFGNLDLHAFGDQPQGAVDQPVGDASTRGGFLGGGGDGRGDNGSRLL